MIRFTGSYFDGVTAKAHQVAVTIQGAMVRIEGDGIAFQVRLKDCRMPPGLSSAACRTLYTPNGGRLDSGDHQAFAKIEDELSPVNSFRIASLLERRWKSVLSALVVLIAAFYLFGEWSVAYLSKIVAFSLPDRVVINLGEEMLSQADNLIFTRSELSPTTHGHIHRLVDDFVAEIGVSNPRRLVFRKGSIGPNAFAFPGNMLVLTDELVALVDDDAELLGVLAHEIAHLKERHALQSALQNAGISLIVTLWVGDAYSRTSVMGTLATLLLNSRYSREFEQEADTQAAGWMLAAGYGVEPMITFLERMQNSDNDDYLPEFFSSHPTLENRIAMLRTLGANPGDKTALF